MARAAQSHDPALEVVWEPSPKQAAFISCPVFEVFFGGARGGGKTDAVLGDFIEHAASYGKNAIGLMLRRTRTELIETIERSKLIYSQIGWEFAEQKAMWTASNGARLRFAYLERDQDAQGYMGHSYTRIYVEEIGNFPSDKPILKLMATLRSGAGVPVGFRATGNPGGPGHQWVKARYIDPAPLGWKVIQDSESGLERVYIPSKVGDNAFLGDQYVQQLKASGSKELVRAWLEGDWSVIEGAFFDCWSSERHVIRPFVVPEHWLRFRSGDWGSASPFAFHWWAVVGDDYTVDSDSGPIVLPRGALVCYREWYGSLNGRPSRQGLKLTAEQVAEGIKERDGKDKITYGRLDPSAFANDGGPSIGERLATKKVYFDRADNKRVTERGAMGGWDQVRSRLIGDGDGRPMLYFFSTCIGTIEELPALQHDPDKPEDVNSENVDHASDSVRYACMSRPWVRKIEKPQVSPHLFIGQPDGSSVSTMTIQQLIDRQKEAGKGKTMIPSGYTRAEAVTKSDSTVLDCKAFYVGGAGNVAIKTHNGATAVTLTACIVGQVYPIQCYNIMSANTTATAIVALW